MKRQIAQAVLLASDIREKSWVEDPMIEYDNMKFPQGHYTVPLSLAALQAVQKCKLEEEMAVPVALLLSTAWNDIIDWAKIV